MLYQLGDLTTQHDQVCSAPWAVVFGGNQEEKRERLDTKGDPLFPPLCRVDPWECYQDTWQTTCSVLEHHRDLMKVSWPRRGLGDHRSQAGCGEAPLAS